MSFVSYAQNFEDIMLWRALGAVGPGFYVDVGAADPVDMSVTKAFYDAGWRGINVEPAPHYLDRLEAARPEDVNLGVVLGREAGDRVFYEIDQTGLSTLDGAIAAAHREAGFPVAARSVEMRTLGEVCREFAPQTIHFLKIDVEGAEAEVLAGADFGRFRPWIVLLEATRPLSSEASLEWEPAMLAAGYRFAWFDGLNRFYIADERFEALNPHFQVPPNAFDDFVMFDFKAFSRIEAQERRIAAQARQIEDQAAEHALMAAEIDLLRALHRETDERNEVLERDHIELLAMIGRLEQDVARLAAQVVQLDAHNTAIDRLRGDLDRMVRDLRERNAALDRYRFDLERLVLDLRWEDGPRVVKLVLPLARGLRRVVGGGGQGQVVAPAAVPIEMPPAEVEQSVAEMAPAETVSVEMESVELESIELAVAAEPDDRSAPTAPPSVVPPRSRRAVHQFHAGCACGDAITNAMLLTQRILRGFGYDSEIYVEHRDPRLAGVIRLLDDLPLHDEYVLIMRHSLGYHQAARLAALPAPKIMMYHNITPAALLSGIPGLAQHAELGREQLDFWRGRVVAALADSPFNALELRQHGFDPVVCPLLFDPDALRARVRRGAERAADQPFTVLFVGRIVESKGQVDLIEAFAAFRTHFGQPCRLILLGRTEGGSDRYVAELFQRIAAHGLRQSVVITGQISDDELVGWYERADMYVSLSLHEGFGVPLIEAMVHDVPVIAYGAGAVPYTMGGCGVLLDRRDPESVAAAMLEIATDPRRRDAIVAGQRSNPDRFALARSLPALAWALAAAGVRPPDDDAARAALARHLSLIVTGHVNGSYSLAAVNRSLALALDDHRPHAVRVLPYENGATDDLSGVPAGDRAAIRRLAETDAPPTAPVVVISQHYPIYAPGPKMAGIGLAIAYFFWEESEIPWGMVEALNDGFDAVFAPSRFVAKVLVDSGVTIPVRMVGYAPRLAQFEALYAARAARPAGAVFTILHVSSAFPRKGIDVLLEAFATAFAGSAGRVRLVIKSFPNPHNDSAARIAALEAAQPDLPEIVLIDRDIGEDTLLEYYRDADVMVLPSRGEGFNIPAAEAMAAGVPLIVTGGGGHADFITANEAVLLPVRAAPSGSHLKTGHSLWFEPDRAALASALGAAFEDFATGGGVAAARAARAHAAVRHRLDRDDWAERITDAIAGLLTTPPVQGPFRIGWVSSWNVGCGVAEYTRHLIGAFAGWIGPDDRMILFADDRTPAAIETIAGRRLTILPAWVFCDSARIDRLAAAVGREDPHVLIIEHQPGLIPWDGLVRLLTDPIVRGRQTIVTLHTTLHLLELPDDEQVAVLEALRSAGRVIVHTIADIELLRGRGVAGNVVFMPQGAPVGLRPQSVRTLSRTGAPLIGCYGFLLPAKGLRELIAAIPLLRADWPGLRVRLVNARYDAVESTLELAACEALAAELGVADCIEWITDFLAHADSMALLHECDLIALAYRPTREASSAALRSCLASGTPVVVTPIRIFDEAGDAVARFDGDTPASIACGISALLDDAERREALAETAAAWLGDHSWPVIGRQLHGMTMGLATQLHAPAAAPAAQKMPPATKRFKA